jgi:predicted N-formylglutamate amidohydrolase
MTGARVGPVLVTCEHGGNRVPGAYRHLFDRRDRLLASHRGWDPGALALARALAGALDAPLVASEVTRLLVDLNRSPHNPSVFSEVTRTLPRAERVDLLERYHRPHWDAVRAALAELGASRGRVLHLGIHSFTPVLNGVRRRPDLALLYDPARPGERALTRRWAAALAAAAPDKVIGRNDPYRGSADGLTTALRTEHSDAEYLGIEIEVSQRYVGKNGRFPRWVADALLRALEEVRDE